MDGQSRILNGGLCGASLWITKIILLAMALYGGSASGVSYNCTGWACGYQGHCLPYETGLHIYVIEVDSIYQKARFCISVAGEGYNAYGTSRFFTSVYKVSSPTSLGKCDSWGIENGVCTNCDSSFETNWLGCPDFQIGFYTQSSELNFEGTTICKCISNPIFFSVPKHLPDTIKNGLPLQEELGPPMCEASVGDPINITNGNLYDRCLDAFVGTDRGLAINFVRHYNSFDNGTSRLGGKWRHNYEYNLATYPESGVIHVREGTGRLVSFRVDTLTWNEIDSVVYTPPIGIHYRLEHDEMEGTYTVIKPDDTRYFFDSEGKLSCIADRNDNRINLNYSDGFLTSIVDASGRMLNLNYQDDKLWQISNESAEVLATYEYYETGGFLKKVTYADNSWVQYLYYEPVDNGPSQPGFLTQVVRSDGVNKYYGYDEDGRATESSRDDSVDRVTASYTGGCGGCPRICILNVRSRSDGEVTAYDVEPFADGKRRFITEVFNPDCPGCGTLYEYDAGGNKTKIGYENGVVDTFSYDVRGNMTSATRAANTSMALTTYFKYHAAYNLPVKQYSKSVANPASADTTYYAYDDYGNLTQYARLIWDSVGASRYTESSYEYNSYGQLTKINGPRNDVADTIVFAYYSNGDLQYVVKPNGDTTEFGQRDEMGNRTWVKNANDMVRAYKYDERNRPSAIILASGTPDSTLTSFTRSFDGDITGITFPEGNGLTFDYDNHDWLTSVVNSIGDSLKYDYDSTSRLSHMEIVDAGGNLKKYEDYLYNSDDLLERITNPDETYTEYEYDEMGNRLSVRDANGHYTYYVYDLLNRLDSAIQMQDTDSLVTRFFYDHDNNLTSLIDADGNQFRFTYNDKGLLLKDSSAVTGVTRYYYDPAGNCIAKVNAEGDSTAYHYDALSRLTLVEYPNPDENLTYVYDDTLFYGRGRLSAEFNASCSTLYRYDLFGNLDEEHHWIEGVEYVAGYDYDKNGDVSTIIYPSGNQILYARDAARRVSEVQWKKLKNPVTLAGSIEYMPFGGPKSWQFGNGINAGVTYDNRYLIEDLKTTNAAVVNRTYGYDAVGNITSILNNLDTDRSKTFGYDDLDQLLSASSNSFPSGPIGFSYSGNGNRLTWSAGEDTTFYNYTNNRLTGLTGAETGVYDYDDLGNLISGTVDGISNTYQYDHAGRLISIDQGSTARYYYDTRSRRVKKTVGNDRQVFVYAPGGQPINEMTTTGKWVADYVYLNGRPLAKIAPVPKEKPSPPSLTDMQTDAGTPPDKEAFYYYHLDHLGTPVAMTDASKTIVWSSDYYPFGGLYDETVVQDNEFRFPGQYHDRETDLYYNWHRYYDSKTGRYTTSDPLGLAAGDINLYRYGNSNSLTFFDPNGQDAVITGDSADAAAGASALDQESGLVITYDCESGCIYSEGEPQTPMDKMLDELIWSGDVTTTLTMTRDLLVTLPDGSLGTIPVDAFNGSIRDQYGQVITSHYLNLYLAQVYEQCGGGTVGQSIIHALNEAYAGATLFPGQGFSWRNYYSAHAVAARVDPPQGSVRIVKLFRDRTQTVFEGYRFISPSCTTEVRYVP